MVILENITKRFKHKQRKNFSRFLVVQTIKTLLTRNRINNNTPDYFNALDGLSLKVSPGERVGILGKNKAGKTTLMQVISGITVPTSGRLEVRGRVIPIFAQGAVITPDQTGREYIYLHAAALGYRPKEVDAVVEDVIAFSGITNIDSLIRIYSTGMRTRLTLSLVLHLQADIYIFDEAFYGSDVFFKEKAIDRFKEIMQDPSKTMILVSHNEDIIRTFCNRLIILEDGKLLADSDVDSIFKRYLSTDAMRIITE
ncbi:hypothetical protein CAP35_02850 [Chitinophagaceae bacterium IBVUCB1]|nr:hypothetical protein CAP35_02850 [Chitinophagaceae bacterium IBVUCB1]